MSCKSSKKKNKANLVSQKSNVKIILENEFGDRRDLLGDSGEYEEEVECHKTFTESPPIDKVSQKQRSHSLVVAWQETVLDRQQKLAKLMDDYSQLVIAVKRGY